MDYIRQHIRNLTHTLAEAKAAAEEEMPKPKSPLVDLLVDHALRQHHRDILLDMILPRGQPDEVRCKAVQMLDDQAERVQLRLNERSARRRRRATVEAQSSRAPSWH